MVKVVRGQITNSSNHISFFGCLLDQIVFQVLDQVLVVHGFVQSVMAYKCEENKPDFLEKKPLMLSIGL